MEPVKPVTGLKSDEGQASVLAEVIREGYWRQRAQEKTQVVEESENTTEVMQRRRSQSETKQVQMRHTYVQFEVNRDTHDIIVRIIDADSGKLLRTLPPDELAKEIIKGNFHPSQLRRRAVLI